MLPSLMPTQRTSIDKKWSGEESLISWAYFVKMLRTNEIVTSLILRSTSLTIKLVVYLYLVHTGLRNST